jgi:hypothetical protein
MIIMRELVNRVEFNRYSERLYDWLTSNIGHIDNSMITMGRNDNASRLRGNVGNMGDVVRILDTLGWKMPVGHVLLDWVYFVGDGYKFVKVSHYSYDATTRGIVSYRVMIDIDDEYLAIQCKLACL